MKRLVISISGLLAVIYLSALPPTTQRTPANGSQHSLVKAAPKTPGELLRQNKKVSDKLSALLRQQNPPVTDLQAASQGFTNLDQLVVAVHTSHNLGIPFDELKSAAQRPRGSLSKAIHLLKPDADVESKVREAVLQALDDLDKNPGELLTQNKKVSDKLSVLLWQQNPPVTDLQAASQGFTNLGELFTAVHISHNLVIPFDQLRTAVQTNGNLGKAIHLLKPDADVEGQAREALLQALDDLDQTPGALLAQNKHLSDALSAFLRQQDPPLTDLQAASQGFTNLGQLLSAVHVSQNLSIPFDQLKTQEQTNGSLGKAIRALKPNADTKAELWEAAVQASVDIEESYWAIAHSSSTSM
jgi:hypothetical protein